MEPIGLTSKNITYNKYTGKTSAELMIIHICKNCSRISCNRIAGDDNTHSIISLFEKSQTLSIETIRLINNANIKLLTNNDSEIVSKSLFGYATTL